jgi:hypothetical protein
VKVYLSDAVFGFPVVFHFGLSSFCSASLPHHLNLVRRRALVNNYFHATRQRIFIQPKTPELSTKLNFMLALVRRPALCFERDEQTIY